MKVYKAINLVQADLAKTGVSKVQENKFDNYKFRGIDDVYNAISPLLARHGLVILPRMISRTCDERVSQKGGVLFCVTVEAEFDFVATEDGSKHTVRTFGEAMDRGDKATNKAMSAAYKYAAFQAFAIPTEGDNDSDASTHEVIAKPGIHKPSDGVEDRLTEPQRVKVHGYVDACKAACDAQDYVKASKIIDALTDPDEKVYAWTFFESPARRKMKQAHASMKAQAAQAWIG